MITWYGDFSNSGAIPTSNKQLTKALHEMGVEVLRNMHNRGSLVAPVLVSFNYPPLKSNFRHPAQAIIAAWEFWGPPGLNGNRDNGAGVPSYFKEVFADYDLVLGISDFNRDIFTGATNTPVRALPLGYNPQEYHPGVEPVDWATLLPDENLPDDLIMLLWVGGSDERHGLQTAGQVIESLPPNYHLFAKMSVNYPNAQLPPLPDRVHFVKRDFASMAPLYRAADALLITARAGGFVLPGLEALACGTPVVSTPLPPVAEYANDLTFIGGQPQLAYYRHPVHADCATYWLIPDVESLVAQTLKAVNTPRRGQMIDLEQWTWAACAKRLLKILYEEFGYEIR